jgi:tripartite ATP-independent transporter DctM subunit
LDIIVVFGLLILLILFGVPVGISMGVSSLVAFFIKGTWNFASVIAQRMYSGSTSFILLAIPFYILAGLLMNEGGMTHRLVGSARKLVGRFTGGMGHVNVLASMLFSGMSGSAVADASGLGLVELEAMQAAGYDKKFSAAITAASSTIGPVVPPSIPFVIYGALTGVSVGRLFLGGIVPGISMGVALMIAVYFVSRKRSYPKDTARVGVKELSLALVNAVAPLGSLIIIVGGIMLGVFTPTEAAVVACLYSLALGLFVYRDLKLSRLRAVLSLTVRYTARVMFIIAVASAYAYALTLMQVPQRLSAGLQIVAQTPWLFLLSVNVLLLFLGCFMESISIMILVVPIFLPIILQIGIDPVHFGVVVTLNLMIGLLTPPMGLSLYSVAAVAKMPVQDIISELWPYFLSLLGVLILITFVPSIVTWIPVHFMG